MTTSETSQAARAARFRALHRGTVLVLPNAWDAGSAAVIEAAGATAIATTSAGVSWAIGAPDAEGVDRQQMTNAVARIVQAVSVPVTADIESGYGASCDDVMDTVRAIIEVGAVGINLEDSSRTGSGAVSLYTVSAQAQRIAAARAVADACGVDLFINVRTDVYLFAVGEPSDQLSNVQARAATYAVAGADGLFVPGLLDLDVITMLAEGPLPVNVMAGPGAPSIGELATAGAARVSVGSAITQSAYDLASRAAKELLTNGTYRTLVNNIDYSRLNTLLSSKHHETTRENGSVQPPGPSLGSSQTTPARSDRQGGHLPAAGRRSSVAAEADRPGPP